MRLYSGLSQSAFDGGWAEADVISRESQRPRLGMPSEKTIGDYAMIGDGASAALIDRSGSLAWLCWPRFDSPAVFASLLGNGDNGAWTIAPTASFRATRNYRPDTLILETRFETELGAALLTDFMPYQGKPQAVIRRLRGLSGAVSMAARFAPCFHYGSTVPHYERKRGIAVASSRGVSLALHATRLELARGGDAVGFDLAAGHTIDFVLTDESAAPTDLASYVGSAEAACEAFWAWTSKCRYQGPWRGAVTRSLITLKALIHAPTGGMVAAPTSSLPEHIGGARN